MSHWWFMHIYYLCIMNLVKFKSHGKCSTFKTMVFSTALLRGYHQMIHLKDEISTAMAISLGSTKEFEGCYVQQFWSRNQGQPACFPKKNKRFIKIWMMSGMSRNHFTWGGMNILLPAEFMSYQAFDPPVMPGVVAGASKRKDPSASWEAQVSGASSSAAGWKVQAGSK